MRDVALEVGFTQTAIYYHFFRQDRLLQACGRPCDQAGDGQHRGRWCAFGTARLPRGCAPSSGAFPPTTTTAYSFSACSSTRIARMRSASRSPPTTARSAGRSTSRPALRSLRSPRSFRAARLRSSSAPSERTPPSRASGTPTRRSPRRRRPKRAPISRRWPWPAAG